MDLQTIKAKVKEHIEQSIAGLSKEDVKFDFKAKWHDLKDKSGTNEFLKDTSAIANTFGLDGFLVYGFDDKANQFTGAKFSDSNLRDSNELYGVLVKGLGEVFDLNHYDIEIEGNHLSVLHIPPALNKPFVIKNYQKFDKKGNPKNEAQRIFVRKNTGTFPATKYDIELMYYDRKNIIPEYAIKIDLFELQLLDLPNDNLISNIFNIEYKLTIENIGKRPICISKILFEFRDVDLTYAFETRIYSGTEAFVSSKIIRSNDLHYFSDVSILQSPFGIEIEKMEEIVYDSELQIILHLFNGKRIGEMIPKPKTYRGRLE